jgi:hypothetical protein
VLVFGSLPAGRSKTARFDDGTEISFFDKGWVTITGERMAEYPAGVEHPETELQALHAQLCQVEAGAQPRRSVVPADGSRDGNTGDSQEPATEKDVELFLLGSNRTPVQKARVLATWELQRGPGSQFAFENPSNSSYGRSIVQEAYMLAPQLGWDRNVMPIRIVLAFACKHGLQGFITNARLKSWMGDAVNYGSSQQGQHARDTPHPHQRCSV